MGADIETINGNETVEDLIEMVIYKRIHLV